MTINEINKLFDGEGQELLNIIILSSSIFCVAWTIIWVNKESFINEVDDKKNKLVNNQISIWPMVLIVMLAISREGAELILFLFGLSASGVNMFDMIYGIICGIVIGFGVGIGAYTGLLKIKTKYFFKVINTLLIILAAGMASQLANFLVAADIISVFSNAIWDSSWLINENNNFLGKLLYGLIGYSSHPTGLQVMFYCGTIIMMSLLLKLKKR